MKSNQNHIEKLTPEVIEQYLSGDLTHGQMHQVEKLMLDSDFDAEAVEGFEEAGTEGMQKDIIDLNARLAARVKTEDKRLYLYLKIAASVLLLAIATFVTIEFIPIDQADTIGQSEDTSEAFEEAVSLPDTADEDSAMENVAPTPKQAPINEKIIQETSPADLMSMKEAPSDDISTPEEPAEETVTLDLEIQDEAFAEDQLDDEVSKPITEAKPEPQNAKTRMTAKRVPTLSQAKKLEGKITSEDSTPLPGVNVIVKGTTQGTVTDIEGQYSISLPANTDSTLVASFIGYESKEVNARGKSTLDIQLSQNNVQLSEVVVTAAGEESKAESKSGTSAAPVGGMKAFETYLENNAVNESRSTVTVSFVVNQEGNLGSFTILKGDNEDLNIKAINLIKNGPAWLPASQNNNSVADTVVLKIKFKK